MSLIPLSFSQLRFWFQDELHDWSRTPTAPVVLRLSGVLDAQALWAALGDVVGRHEVLRTVFPVVDGQPRQRVLSPQEAGLEFEVRTVSADEVAEEAEEFAQRPFDLKADVPLRAALFVVGTANHVLVASIHHIAFDGWSVAPFLRDLSTAYEARLGGVEPGWDELPVQYADFTLWQRELLGVDECVEGVLQEQLDFWRGCLAGMREELVLPWDRARPVVGSGCAGAV
ncbi:condensation domain-containing protein, partial [Streptomyces hygroscopicus]|uniref:condensation domain-containing protein n=1 Tax=Streptomyces hygroscopicus TaxID=1912 RepID=UPI0036D09AAB